MQLNLKTKPESSWESMGKKGSVPEEGEEGRGDTNENMSICPQGL